MFTKMITTAVAALAVLGTALVGLALPANAASATTAAAALRTPGPDVTVMVCIAECVNAGFSIGGLENSYQCYCSN
ncbi:WSC domain-containing protein [Spirillospora sp. NPDC050679]